MKVITVKAPVNIAVIKYWGKTDEKLILPTNDSISGTLSIDDLYALTSVAADSSFPEDEMFLNGQKVDIATNPRLGHCLEQLRAMCADSAMASMKIKIVSRNNFPTAAGLASSAAGYACLVYAMSQLYDIKDINEITILARMGSGSAIRSIFGGFVHWIADSQSRLSISKQIVDHYHWPEMKILILVVNDEKKDIGSTTGMKLSIQTSEFMQARILSIVPSRIDSMIRSIQDKDFDTFSDLTMKDSNSFHAICLDTFPPIRYLNDISWKIIKLVHSFNTYHKSVINQSDIKVAYTFDAGPNACIYLLDKSLPIFYSVVQEFFQTNDIKGQNPPNLIPTSSNLKNFLLKEGNVPHPGALKYLINTKIGPGPQIVTDKDLQLIDSETGNVTI